MRTSTWWVIVAILLVVAIALVGTGAALAGVQQVSPGDSTQRPVSGVTHVFMRNNAYQPANIEVVIGTAVTWTNQDNVIHSVVLPHAETAENIVRESGSLSQGQSFSYAFGSLGTFEYYCTEHPYMIGIVMVIPKS